MNRSSPTFCVMPHLGLAVQNEGDICACNINSQSYQLDNTRQTIDKITIDQIWQSPTRKEIAAILDSGVRNPGCQACWQDEDAGIKSSRQELNELFEGVEPSEDQPKVLIVKPGNTCNAACRMCRPETSSSWYRDAFELTKQKNPSLTFKEYIKDFESVKNSFNPDSPNLWPVLNKWYKEMEFIDIYGGEPWMIPGLWTSLQEAIEQDYAKDISLRLHTNGSWWDDKNLEILSKFKKVNIGLSIDSHIPAEFEYIRHRLKYDTVMANSKKFMEYAKDHSNIEISICTTITTFNIYNLDDIIGNLKREFATTGYTPIMGYTNFVYNPTIYDIRHLPKDVKQIVANRLKKHEKFSGVLEFMNQVIPGCVIHWPQFCLETDKLDRIRSTNFKEVYPEWANILEPYWNYKKPHPEWYGSCSL